ncbi:unnamed protein product [Phaedon cochleariae]|uniref:SH3 domain-containing protein n=1 Tax=Phaedon cochleariae TaxID=80249 RepID=A0A9N9SEC0_PHACE|nr:unnamed protein product [Phaedon cochleariae]
MEASRRLDGDTVHVVDAAADAAAAQMRRSPHKQQNHGRDQQSLVPYLRTALYDYEAQGEDELSLRKGQIVEVLSEDAKISGDEGWWTGKIGDKVGIFPSNFVAHQHPFTDHVNSVIADIDPVRIDFAELELEEVIGVGGFGKVPKSVSFYGTVDYDRLTDFSTLVPSYRRICVNMLMAETPYKGIDTLAVAMNKELRCREEDLNRAQLQQRRHEEQLRQKEQWLDAREMELIERELHLMIKQQTPTPIKRKGKFKRSRLKILKKEPGTSISFPSDFRHTITVQHTTDHKVIGGIISPNSPPGSPAIPRLRAIALPADGVKGKTWGPSTCHQRERGQIIRPAANRSAIWSKSAPNLDKTRTRPAHEIGNSSPTDTSKSSGLQLILNKVTALSPLAEWRRLGGAPRNNSLPTNNASLIGRSGLGRNHRLSRSIGNISESHYDTVFSTNSFVIARGTSGSVDFGNDYVGTEKDDEEYLLNSKKTIVK